MMIPTTKDRGKIPAGSILISTFPSPASEASTSKYVGSSDFTPSGLIPGPVTLTLDASDEGLTFTLNGLRGMCFPP